MTRLVTWLVALVILVGAGVVIALEPGEQTSQGPFVIDVALQQKGTGRDIEATFHTVRLADVVQLDELDGWRGTTEGVWVVVDATVATVVSTRGMTSFLLIGDREFRGSERLDFDGLESVILAPGLPTAGTILFEIPKELAETATSARLLVASNSDRRLDSAIGTTIDLSALTVESTVTVEPAKKVTP